MNKTNDEIDISSDIKSRTGVDPEKAITISKLVEEYTLQKVERINPIEVVRNNLARIEDIIKNQMTEGRHFGIQEGTSKKTLKNPGSDILLMNFSMRPSYKVEITELENDHREYVATCYIYKFIDLENSLLVGEGSGSCSTKEKKYRLRWTPINYSPTADYWKYLKGKRFAEAKMCLPNDIESRKIGDRWIFCRQQENPDIHDVYNTVLKMARIRAKREAIQTLFAIAGAFDFIDMDDDQSQMEKVQRQPELQTHPEDQKDPEKKSETIIEPKDKPKDKNYMWPHTFTDIISPDWYKQTLQKAKSADEIQAFMEEFSTDMKMFEDDLQKEIHAEAEKAYRIFKPKKNNK